MLIRKADKRDLELLITLRLDYLRDDLGNLQPKTEAALADRLRDYFLRHIEAGDFIAVLAEEDGRTLAAAFLILAEKPANPSFPTGKTGTVMNVLTYQQYRKKGIATRVLGCLIDEAKSAGVSMLELSATKDGEPLYRKLGFKVNRYTSMRLGLS